MQLNIVTDAGEELNISQSGSSSDSNAAQLTEGDNHLMLSSWQHSCIYSLNY